MSPVILIKPMNMVNSAIPPEMCTTTSMFPLASLKNKAQYWKYRITADIAIVVRYSMVGHT